MIDLATIMRSLEKAAEKAPEYFGMAEDTANFYYGSFAGLALTVFNLVPSVTNMFGKAMLPRASAAYAAGDSEKLSECSLGLIKTVTYLAVPCGIGISVLAAPVLNALFSGSPREAAAAARPLSVHSLRLVSAVSGGRAAGYPREADGSRSGGKGGRESYNGACAAAEYHGGGDSNRSELWSCGCAVGADA